MVFLGFEQIIIYVSLLIVAFLGLPIGLILAAFSPDEAHKYKNFFIPLQMLFLVLFFLILLFYLPLFVSASLIILSFSFLFLFWHKLDHNVLDYIIFSLLLIFFTISQMAFLYSIIVIFLFGMFSGFLFFVLHTKDPLSKKKTRVKMHKHTGKHLSFESMLSKLLKMYYFVLILTFVVFCCSFLASFFIKF